MEEYAVPVYSEWSKQVSDKQQLKDIPIEALVQFKHYIRFVSCDPTKNRNRFYLLTWQPALDGSAALVCMWGRIGTQGHARATFYLEQANAQDVIARLIRRRVQRGYQISDWQ